MFTEIIILRSELGDEDEMGIEGILSRLEKQRNLSFWIDLGKNGQSSHVVRDYGDKSPLGTSRIAGKLVSSLFSKLILYIVIQTCHMIIVFILSFLSNV